MVCKELLFVVCHEAKSIVCKFLKGSLGKLGGMGFLLLLGKCGIGIECVAPCILPGGAFVLCFHEMHLGYFYSSLDT